MRVLRDDVQLCEDCMVAAVNGDFSGLEQYYGAATEAKIRQIEAGLSALGPHLVTAFGAEGEYHEFSRHPCECCKSELGGNRYRFAILANKEHPAGPNDTCSRYGCGKPAVTIVESKTSLMSGPGFYPECEEHRP